MNVWTLMGVGIDTAILFMVAVWWICRRLNNAGFVDAAWAYGFALVVWIFAAGGEGAPWRRDLLALLVTIWSLRLGTHLLFRVTRRHPEEDPRYRELREIFPKRPWFMFFGFFQLQAVLIGLLVVPFAIACSNPLPVASGWEIAGAALWVIAFLGEIVADAQLAAFRKKPENLGKVCQTGLWRYSRHPNYFFEWLLWMSYFLFAVGMPGGWITIYGPLLMLLFLTKVTGIPPAEAQALKSRGDAYRDYQRRTSAFVPWLPR